MDWKPLLTLLVMGMLLLAVARLFRRKAPASTPNEKWPFYPRRPLSEVEQAFYWRLTKTLPEYVILPQIQLSRFLGVKRGNNIQQWLNRINRMSVDFLVCNKDFSILAAIEIDDATHRKPERIQADAKKDKAIQDAGLRIIRWPASPLPDADTIRAAVTPLPSQNGRNAATPITELRAEREDRLSPSTARRQFDGVTNEAAPDLPPR